MSIVIKPSVSSPEQAGLITIIWDMVTKQITKLNNSQSDFRIVSSHFTRARSQENKTNFTKYFIFLEVSHKYLVHVKFKKIKEDI